MTSPALERARAYERERIPLVPKELLPHYHLTGIVGWLNDPNGFSEYQGEYHLFFQYNPYDTRWASMHWGHVKTRDLLRWERLPAALAPDAPFDKDGCFSGSAVETPDGRHLIMYTGVRKELGPDGEEREYQTQCLAVGDGVDYEKNPLNPVIAEAQLPPGGSIRDFRDPKLWREDGRYFAVVGDRCPDGSGAVLLYESEDALDWRYVCELAASRGRQGRMWECPDFFPLDGVQVLLVSPQEMQARGLEFIEGNVTLCLVGDWDREIRRFTPMHEQTIDYGLDFYAPQTLLTSDGRRVMIAWMQYWNSTGWKPEALPFAGQHTLPRELHVRNGRLYQTPVREIEAHRADRVSYTGVCVEGETTLAGVSGRCIDLTVGIRPAAGCRLVRLDVAAGEGFRTSILYRPGENTITVDRSESGAPETIVNERTFAVRGSGELTLRLLLDRYSVELFANGGEQAATFVIYTPEEADGIRFSTEGCAELDIEKFSLVFS